MPVSVLLVEGPSDVVMLKALLANGPVVRDVGGKGVIRPATYGFRLADKPGTTFYLRDRDFDYDPPANDARPVDDDMYFQQQLGWRWCRHSIECYQIDPAIIEASGIVADRAAYEAALVNAGKTIRAYQVSRWALGQCRRKLPRRLGSRADDVRDDKPALPTDLSEPAVIAAARELTSRYAADVQSAIAAFDAFVEHYRAALSAPEFDTVAGVLRWCSGKDLAKATEPWLQARGIDGAQTVLNKTTEWMRDNAERVTELLPEWGGLKALMDGR